MVEDFRLLLPGRKFPNQKLAKAFARSCHQITIVLPM